MNQLFAISYFSSIVNYAPCQTDRHHAALYKYVLVLATCVQASFTELSVIHVALKPSTQDCFRWNTNNASSLPAKLGSGILNVNSNALRFFSTH